jgi:uncharacterized protein YciI
MFLVLVNYKKPLDIIDKHLADHRAFLDEGYKQDFFIVSGPRNPRTGGIIISQLNDRAQLETILSRDPFQIHDVAEYEIVEFMPIKHHQKFTAFLSDK